MQAACTIIVPTAVACTTLHSSHILQEAAREFLAQFAGKIPASAVHRVVMFPLLAQLQLGDHVATALLLVRFGFPVDTPSVLYCAK
jgi:hypothetical protein